MTIYDVVVVILTFIIAWIAYERNPFIFGAISGFVWGFIQFIALSQEVDTGILGLIITIVIFVIVAIFTMMLTSKIITLDTGFKFALGYTFIFNFVAILTYRIIIVNILINFV